MSPWHFSCSNSQEMKASKARITHRSPALLAKCPTSLVLHQWMNKGTNSSKCLTRVNLNVRKGTCLTKGDRSRWFLSLQCLKENLCKTQKFSPYLIKTSALGHIDSSNPFPAHSHFFSSKFFFPGVWHFQFIPGSWGSPGGPKHGGPGGKVKPANRNVTQSFPCAFSHWPSPPHIMENCFCPKYCLNFKYTISRGTRMKRELWFAHKTSVWKLPWMNNSKLNFIELLEMTEAHQGNQAPFHCGVLKLF